MNIYLNVKCILTFLNVLTPKICIIHKNNHIEKYTPWETLEKFCFALPYFLLHIITLM